MGSKREWLVSQGLAKPGRGKFSNAAKEALAKAEAEGIVFSDAAPTTTAPKSDAQVAPVVKSAGDTPYLTPDEYRFPEAEYKAVGADGKTYGMREVCNTCRVSLVNHFCDSPTIYGNIAVHIRKR